MKVKYLGALAIGALMLTGCNSTPQPKEISQLSNATLADSLAYYLGEQGAMSYWRATAQDSTMKSEASKAAYLAGFKKGMEMVSEDEAFNTGLSQGMSLAMYYKTLEKEYDLDMNNNPALAGFAFGMQNDTIVNPSKLQQDIMPLGRKVEAIKEAKDKEEADKKIAEEMQKSGYERDENGVAYKVVDKGQDKKLEIDEMVLVELTMTDVAGKPIVPSEGKPRKMVVGQESYVPIVNKVLPKMSVGATYKVLGSATEIFGPQARQFRMKGSDIGCIEIKVVSYCDDKGEVSASPIKVAKTDELKLSEKK